ncbi:hypothetical protein IV203_015412 [Nitzschia inconspicua]|uniref:Uncharacterized protein n=1 Tax=Nitzschia inconspicua TaxID=303405 RepID=A0A9K3LBA2_9STRA|nr:hypothetical protein IV203_015412 [Nitzschia inconspicua]
MVDITAPKASSSEWIIWKAADSLELKAKNDFFYPDLTLRVIRILRQEWSQFVGLADWRPLLNLRTLQCSLEESIIAIALCEESMATLKLKEYIAVDVCAGKGLYSLLLSFLRPPHLQSIVMIERAAINWHPIHAANNIHDGRPRIEIWEKTNIHDYDNILERLLNLPFHLVVTGIHLCKQLSPAFCGLVNGLGGKCLMACLAPCCLPRICSNHKGTLDRMDKDQVEDFKDILVLPVRLGDMINGRTTNKCMKRRIQDKDILSFKPTVAPVYSKSDNNSLWCYFCHDPGHALQSCSLLRELCSEKQIQVRLAAQVTTSDCPIAVVRTRSMTKLSSLVALDLSLVFQEPMGSDTSPFKRYCEILSTSLQHRSMVKVVDVPLENSSVHQQESLFLVIGAYEMPE